MMMKSLVPSMMLIQAASAQPGGLPPCSLVDAGVIPADTPCTDAPVTGLPPCSVVSAGPCVPDSPSPSPTTGESTTYPSPSPFPSPSQSSSYNYNYTYPEGYPGGAEGCVNCDAYSQLNAPQKLGTLWSKIEASEYEELPQDWIRPQDIGRLTDGLDVNFVFDRFSDERPGDVKRFFHEYGSVAQVEWVGPTRTPSAFTGLFQGSDYGLLRVSHCAPLFTLGVRPPYSFALKMMRSGMYSANVATCEPPRGNSGKADPDDYNVFRRTLTTSTRLGTNNQALFGAAQNVTGFLSPVEPGLYTQDGEKVDSVVAPPLIIFEPNQELADSLPGNKDFRVDLDLIPEGSTLYTGYATVDDDGKPEMCMCYDTVEGKLPCWTLAQAQAANCTVVNLGSIKTRSRFVASQYGDEKLLFKHTRFCESERVTCEGDNPIDGYSDRYAIEGKEGAQCISKRQNAALQCPFLRNIVKSQGCAEGLDNNEGFDSLCPIASTVHPSLTSQDDIPYPEEGEYVEECLLPSPMGAPVSVGVINRGCCGAIGATVGNFFSGGRAALEVDRDYLCEDECLSVLSSAFPMVPAPEVCGENPEVVCEEGQLRVFVTGDVSLGAADSDQCSEFCIPPFVLSLISNAAEGTCESVGYTDFVQITEVTLAGGPSVQVEVWEADDTVKDCESGFVRISFVDNEEFGSGGGKCSQACVPAFVPDLVEGEILGSCGDAGYTVFVGVTSVPMIGEFALFDRSGPPPVNCVQSEWTPAGECSYPCGTGERAEVREVVTIPEFGGEVCGPSTRTAPCNNQRCTVEDFLDECPVSRSCLEVGYVIRGGNKLSKARSASAEECQERCQANEHCDTFKFNKSKCSLYSGGELVSTNRSQRNNIIAGDILNCEH